MISFLMRVWYWNHPWLSYLNLYVPISCSVHFMKLGASIWAHIDL
jgi:hypothetical protein